MMIVKTYLLADQFPDAVSGPIIDEGTGEFTVVGAAKGLDPTSRTHARQGSVG
jgi:hypothetical protein